MKFLSKIKYNAPVTLTFAAISLLVLGLDNLTGGSSTKTFFETYRSSWSDLLMYPRLFTHVLGHANWAHFSGNMLLFLLLGPILEEKYGSKNLLEMICLTAGLTGIINNVFFPHTALLGASGIVFMFIILASVVGNKEGEIPLTFLLVFGIYVGGELLATFAQDNISQLAHIIGGLCGGFFGIFYTKEMRRSKK